ncbi:hypothetical protein LPTSP4_27830 [Leptospira ryugenii]|uniref:Uncharacterized protein n=1 Tax=Leptospira ryugenii TaxID=1917863 RepID=A0A2P2E308_9LEPT|nr:hypothetical protein LPTSP4_27830 [Leptospira ryugenii]
MFTIACSMTATDPTLRLWMNNGGKKEAKELIPIAQRHKNRAEGRVNPIQAKIDPK